jgi:DNA-binding response OmpR family regulator
MAGTQRILVVEDDPSVAEGLLESIGREGFDVQWCSTGEGGIECARAWRPHAVILDVRLPDGSGFDVCQQMRQEGMRHPILMLTARTDEVDRVLGLERGADDYVTKPFRVAELLARIRAQIRRAYGDLSSAESDVLYAGDLVIDRSRALVAKGGREIALTPIEFRLLVFFAQHPGQALSREQLIDGVWGSAGEYSDPRSVNVHIRHLREKVEDDPSDPELILTVTGIGYRLAT